ncbi:MAG: hypothetical protein ACLRV7_00415 [Hoylesella buccalis]
MQCKDNNRMEVELMDDGEYTANGGPTAYTAWERSLGWMEIEELQDAQQVTLKNIDEDGKAYRIWKGEKHKRILHHSEYTEQTLEF